MPMAIIAIGGHLDDEVDEVGGGEEVAVLRLEDDRDDDQAEDDRQRAELAGAHADPPAADGVAQRPGLADSAGPTSAPRPRRRRVGLHRAHAVGSC